MVRQRLEAFSPEGFPAILENLAVEEGTPIHDALYAGHMDQRRVGRGQYERYFDREDMPGYLKRLIEKEFAKKFDFLAAGNYSPEGAHLELDEGECYFSSKCSWAPDLAIIDL